MDNKKSDIPEEHFKATTGEWMVQDHREHKAWLTNISKHIEQNPSQLAPCLVEFRDEIKADTRLSMLAQSMFDQVPKRHPYNKSVDDHQVVQDFDHLLAILNHIITTGPEWTEKSHRVGVVGTCAR